MAVIIYFSLLGLIAVALYWENIQIYYYHLSGKKMSDLFPKYYDWEPGDKIVYRKTMQADEIGVLVLMSEDGIIVEHREYTGCTQELLPQQIKYNACHEKRKKIVKYREFHADILPLLASREPKSFPALEGRVESIMPN